MKLCIIVPMYNEEAIAKESVETILAYSTSLPILTTLVIINDGSSDGTQGILGQLLQKHNSFVFKVLQHKCNLGYGAALRTGINYAINQGNDYVLFMDSDLTNHPKYILRFVEKMQEGFDYIKATRYAMGGRVEGVQWKHRLISTIGNLIARRIYNLPLTDITNGFRAVRVDILKKIHYSQNDFAIILEELNQAKSFVKTFCEVPYVLTTRSKGTSRFSYSPRTSYRYLKLAISSRQYKKLIDQ